LVLVSTKYQCLGPSTNYRITDPQTETETNESLLRRSKHRRLNNNPPFSTPCLSNTGSSSPNFDQDSGFDPNEDDEHNERNQTQENPATTLEEDTIQDEEDSPMLEPSPSDLLLSPSELLFLG